MYSCLTIEYAELVTLTETNFIPSMDRVAQSESTQYNSVGSKEPNFTDMNRNIIYY